MTTNTNSRLLKLSHSDFEIADGQPDIRGWDVKDAQGKYIGEVEELIFDKESLKVRYIVLDLDDNDFNVEERDVLVPIGLAELHEKGDDVLLPNVTAAQLTSLPEYNENNISEEMETSIRSVFSGAVIATGAVLSGAESNKEDFYDHDHFNEDNLYQRRKAEEAGTISVPVIEEQLQVGKKVVETGGLRLKSRIIETPVEEDIRLREEHVKIEREAVNRPATEADFHPETIELIEKAEVPVVSKEAFITEEVTLNKKMEEHDQIISETLKSTEVDVERTDKGTIGASKDL